MSATYQENNLSRRIVQFISKFKLVKPKNQTEVMNEVENPVEIIQTSITDEITSVENVQIDVNEQNKKANTNGKFKFFCHEIKNFINLLKNNEDLNYYIYKYPQLLQQQVNSDIDELQYVLSEIKETMSNIKKLKSQQKLIKKEISAVKKSIQRIKDIEIRELELVVSRYDKDLYIRWMKSKWKFEAIEELMCDVQEKQVVLKTLSTLINRYTEKIKENNASIDEQSEKNSTDNDKSVPLSPSISSLQTKVPLPPPIPSITIPRPIPLTTTTLNRNNSQYSWVQRRFRAERRGNFNAVRPITENNENEPCIFSLNINNNARNNISSNSNTFESQSRFSTNSTENSSSTSSNNQTDTSSNSAGHLMDDLELKSELESVLKALFGQRTPPLMITDNNNKSVTEASNEENSNVN